MGLGTDEVVVSPLYIVIFSKRLVGRRIKPSVYRTSTVSQVPSYGFFPSYVSTQGCSLMVRIPGGTSLKSGCPTLLSELVSGSWSFPVQELNKCICVLCERNTRYGYHVRPSVPLKSYGDYIFSLYVIFITVTTSTTFTDLSNDIR